MAKSYFAILGVSEDASPKEIQSAYRRLAKELHPDHYPGDSKPFHQVQEAYAVLGDLQRRHAYQKSLAKPVTQVPKGPPYPGGPEPLIPAEAPTDAGARSPLRSLGRVSPVQDDPFHWLRNNVSTIRRAPARRPRVLELEIPLSRRLASRGGVVNLVVPLRAVCPACRGHGPYECTRCLGQGALVGDVPVSILFPPGIPQDQRIEVPLGRFGFPDLSLTVRFRLREGEYI
ncbi:MAG: DnaJ domain-containing protein [Desulfobacterales bacterium]